MDGGRRVSKQSGAIPFLRDSGGLRVMLVTPRSGGRWIIPKGNVAKGMSPGASAAKEAFEEAGVEGSCRGRPLGSYEYRKGGQRFKVEVFPMRIDNVLEEWQEASERRRRLFKIGKAVSILQEDGLREIVAKLARNL